MAKEKNWVEFRLYLSVPSVDEDDKDPMVAFTDDIDDIIIKHFPENAEDAEYEWEYI